MLRHAHYTLTDTYPSTKLATTSSGFLLVRSTLLVVDVMVTCDRENPS